MGRIVYYDTNGNEVNPPKADAVKQTNADRIRAMTDEELAGLLANVANQGGGSCAPGCYDCSKRDTCKEAWLDWLKREANNG